MFIVMGMRVNDNEEPYLWCQNHTYDRMDGFLRASIENLNIQAVNTYRNSKSEQMNLRMPVCPLG